MLGLRAQMLWLMWLEDEKACCCVWVFSVLGDTQQVPVEYFSFAAQGPEMAGKAKHMRVCSSHHGLDATKSWHFCWKRVTSTGADMKARGYGATAARLTPDQKVGSSNLFGLIWALVFLWLPTPPTRRAKMVPVGPCWAPVFFVVAHPQQGAC